ncbi:TPA: hypothetical protein HA241_07575 [Candidatus Woesearchaeota archaeon]|nr:hypothetical protein [Candidatus Woesearchaeota archaeon]
MSNLDNLLFTPTVREKSGCHVTALSDQVDYISSTSGGSVPTDLTKGDVLVYTQRGSLGVEFYFGGLRQEVEPLDEGRRFPFIAGTEYRLLTSPGSRLVQFQLNPEDPLRYEKSTDGKMGSAPQRDKNNGRTIVNITPRVRAFTVHDLDNIRLGDNYHETTPQLFFVEDGKTHCKLENPKNGQKVEYTIEAGQFVVVPHSIAYLLIPDPHACFLGILGADFNPGDLRTHRINL